MAGNKGTGEAKGTKARAPRKVTARPKRPAKGTGARKPRTRTTKAAKAARAAKTRPPETIEIEAGSIEEAREEVTAQMPKGFTILRERIIQMNEPVEVSAEGEDAEAAYAKATANVPEGAEVIERRETRPVERGVLGVDAFTEEEARAAVPGDVRIEGLTKTVEGKSGFLGIGKKPARYEIATLRPALVEVRYRLPLKVSFRVGNPEDAGGEEILDLTAGLAGGWPPELRREMFDDFDLDGLMEWSREFGTQQHPGGFGMLSKPTYRIEGGKIAREANGVEDCMIASTASRLSGRGTVTPFDDRASRYTLELIQLYGGWTLAKFVFLLPFAERIAGAEGPKVIITEDAIIKVYKGVENALFEIYDDLREGETFNDGTVRQKLLSYVERFARTASPTD